MMFRISSFGTGSGFSRRIDPVVWMIFEEVVPWDSSGVECSLRCD